MKLWGIKRLQFFYNLTSWLLFVEAEMFSKPLKLFIIKTDGKFKKKLVLLFFYHNGF